MNAKELKAELVKTAREISPTAEISVFIDAQPKGHAIFCGVYPFGHDYSVLSAENFVITGDDYGEVLAAVRAKWSAMADEMRNQRVRRMALAIIRITAEQGHCTDAALRQEFKAGEVTAWGVDACADANAIAGKSPFSIVKLGGANGAPDKIEEGAKLQ